MNTQLSNRLSSTLVTDLPSSVVVFLVALPLCLGIALASGAPLFSGIIAGIVGGVVVGALSQSPLSVSGPAAGLTSIVVASIQDLGSFSVFLSCVVLAGVLQVAFGFLKAGVIGHFVPVAVIKGMLAAIGLILILKQLPHAVGYDVDFEGDESFMHNGKNTFGDIIEAFSFFTPGAVIIALISIVILLLWDKPILKQYRFFQLFPGALFVVLAGIGLNFLFKNNFPNLEVQSSHLVNFSSNSETTRFIDFFSLPDFSQLANSKVFIVAITLALVASLETLLNIEAADKLDPFKRITSLDHELKSQGVGNIVSGLIGGLPVTSVIVRTSANVASGAKSKASAISHGFLLLIAVALIPSFLQLIPLASLAGILLVLGYKLTSVGLFKEMFKKGYGQFVPFIVTIVAILFSDLLIGVFIGILVGIFFVLKTNFKSAIMLVNDGDNFLLKFTKDVSFLNKASLRKSFESIPNNASLIIDGSNAQFIDQDIIATVEDFKLSAPTKNIDVQIKKSNRAQNFYFKNE
ncbi:MAG TPA: SulP family inorganic anion transporter [Chryseolinea sp.]|nr:SulP family inorganic anion transporter [Chryseolinea sp.]